MSNVLEQKRCASCNSLVFAPDDSCWRCGEQHFTSVTDVDTLHEGADALYSAARPATARGLSAPIGLPALLVPVVCGAIGAWLFGWWGLTAAALAYPVASYTSRGRRRDQSQSDPGARATALNAASRERAARLLIQLEGASAQAPSAAQFLRAPEHGSSRQARHDQLQAARVARDQWVVKEIRGEGMIRFRLADGYLDAIKTCIDRHVDALARKRAVLLRRDDYGIEHPEAWQKERDYFVEHVVFPALRDAVRAHAPRNKALSRYFEEPTHPLAVATPISMTLQALRFAVPPQDALGVIADIIDNRVSDRQRAQARDARPFVPSNPTAAGIEFEHHCAGLLRAAGWDASVTTASGDQGVDVVATRGGFRLAVQCKWYASPVGNEAVQQVAAGRTFYGAHAGLVVSNAGYTEAARRLAAATGVTLVDEAGLVAGAGRARAQAS